MKKDLTFLGSVQKVIGTKVFVEISEEIPSTNPIIYGKIYRVGQVGSFVKIPLGFHNVYGLVQWLVLGYCNVQNSEIVRSKVNVD